MTYAFHVASPGGPEALLWAETALPAPGKHEVLLRHTAIGVNFIDIYYRSGLYAFPALPGQIGQEAAGIVEAIGAGVTDFSPGDRVAYCGGPQGAYAEKRLIPARHLVPLPGFISDETAAACLLKGLTAQYLLRRTFPVQPTHTLLFHAAAGGVGLIACQWANYLGATVIGTVGSEEKAALAEAHGCALPILYRRESVVERVKAATQNMGVDVVYDSIGRTTFMDSLDCLKRFGMLVSFGQSSGPIPAFEPLLLTQKGSLYLTRPSLMHHIEDTNQYRSSAKELFTLIGNGTLTIQIGKRYALKDARQAHIDLASRNSSGSLILLP